MVKFLFKKEGFSLVEAVIYIAIFAVSAVFLIGILNTVTRVETRQSSVNEVNEQISFVQKTIQDLVQNSSLVDIPLGVSTSTLKLRIASSTDDPTLVYSSGNILYIDKNGSQIPITNSSVLVDGFSVTKYENFGSLAVVQIDLTLTYNTSNPQSRISRSLKSAITRISAATFDSTVQPNSDNSLDLGVPSTNRWRNGYLSGNLDIAGRLGVGLSPSASARVKTNGDIGFSTSSGNGAGVVLMSPSGSCFRLGISNSGGFTTTSAACP